ncbi:unnamed protein product [Trichogramma brassicae]|uniref:Uncharacterized protein n=1 Tax=Trichogramma brassicae TaxID=86971 RepID=A0A6H5I5P5_9HYME|nr:unnamed protein product [Trichogramma brassicae]
MNSFSGNDAPILKALVEVYDYNRSRRVHFHVGATLYIQTERNVPRISHIYRSPRNVYAIAIVVHAEGANGSSPKSCTAHCISSQLRVLYIVIAYILAHENYEAKLLFDAAFLSRIGSDISQGFLSFSFSASEGAYRYISSSTRREYCPRRRFPRGSRPGFTRSEHHATLVTNQVGILYFWTISSRSRPGFTRSEHHEATLVTNQVGILYFWTISSRRSPGFYPFRAPRHASHNQVEILYFWTISSRKSTGFLPVQSKRHVMLDGYKV